MNAIRRFFPFCALVFSGLNGLNMASRPLCLWAEEVLPSYPEARRAEQAGQTGQAEQAEPNNFEGSEDLEPPPRRRPALPYQSAFAGPFAKQPPETQNAQQKTAAENEGAENIEANGAEANTSGGDAMEDSPQEGAESPIPPFPNYPESTKPKPPRTPKQEYLYLNHLYFEPLAIAVGGFWSFGYLGMVGSGKALRLGLDIYNAGTNIALLIDGVSNNKNYQATGILLRLGIHFFLDEAQPKGFALGMDLRSGLLILPSSGNAVVVQATIEIPVAYRFILTFYSRTGRPALTLGIAPYLTLSVGGFLATSTTTGILSANDKGFKAYLSNGNLFVEPNFVSHIDPIGLRVALRFGLDISFVF